LVQNQSKIEQIVLPIVQSKGAFLVEISVRGERTGKIIEIFADTATGITTELCAEISREVSPLLDDQDVIQGKYHLIVSSPGLDKPLKLPQQYRRNIGRNIVISAHVEGQTKKITGEIADANDERVVVRSESGTQEEVAFADIAEALVIPKW
jgi:ribosome maturation factor RimP